jgi:hypothetical protein
LVNLVILIGYFIGFFRIFDNSELSDFHFLRTMF